MPQLVPLLDHNAPQQIAQEITRLQQNGCVTIAVIEKLPTDCRKLHKKLAPLVNTPIRLLSEDDDEYTGGIMVLPAHLSKGLEFDGVIIANANEGNWPDDVLHARLLFVCLTRPLHHLTIFFSDKPSALLSEATL